LSAGDQIVGSLNNPRPALRHCRPISGGAAVALRPFMINRAILFCVAALIVAGCEETTTEVTPPVARDAFALALEAHGGEAKIALAASYTVEATGDCY
jgi:hypothetical protein